MKRGRSESECESEGEEEEEEEETPRENKKTKTTWPACIHPPVLEEAEVQAIYKKMGVFRFLVEKNEKVQVLAKVACSANVGYVFDHVPKALEDMDALDKAFVASQSQEGMEGLEKREIFGWHTYGGYWGFFRPDIVEICRLISTLDLDLARIERIWATTEPWPSLEVSECFCHKEDRHRGKTTLFILKKTNEI